MNMEEQKHLQYAGHLLILSIWVQNVMTDLLIFKKFPDVLKEFNDIENFSIEKETLFYSRRIEYWQKNLGKISKEFLELFPELLNYQFDFDHLEHFRDLLAHGHYSLKHDIVVFQPNIKNKRKFNAKMKTLVGVESDVTEKSVMKVNMSEKHYSIYYKELMIFEREIFPLAALMLNVDLNRLK